MIVCKICSEAFTNNKIYSNHVRWKHKEISQTSCPDCGQIVMSHHYKKHVIGCQKLLTAQKHCKECNAAITVKYNQFCNRSCSAIYNNTHKTHGTRRSKLEHWLEDQLTILYPSLEIHFNRKDAINSELDFYFPSLKLAFELNGIFHYEPIYGADKLLRTQNNDNRKFQACIEQGIELCIIDSSNQKYFKTATSQKYLDIIINVIESKQSRERGI